MEKQAIKEVMYGGLSELMQNRKYFYHSDIGRQYCHWTDDGKLALDGFITEVSTLIYKAEQEALDKRAQQMTFNILKGDHAKK